MTLRGRARFAQKLQVGKGDYLINGANMHRLLYSGFVVDSWFVL